MHSRAPRWSVVAVVLVLAVSSVAVFAQARRDFSVTARKYGYTVSDSSTAEIRVHQNDMVTITFSAEDIPHSFTIEDHPDSHYRIMRRAEPGKPVSFDFRADSPGRFRFYCSLTIDEKCKEMQGTLVVDPK